MAQEEEIKSFAEFWPHYVADHSLPDARLCIWRARLPL